MSFREFYDWRQANPEYVKRNIIQNEVLRVNSVRKISCVIVDNDISVCRGMYISPRNEDSQFARQFGNHVIAVARDQNECWRRFVTVKETMHLFADPESAVDSGEEFERLLDEFANPSREVSPQMLSEYDCFWMALAAICREEDRLEFQKLKGEDKIGEYDIALRLKIPQQYVPRLFEARYRPTIDRLLAA